MVVSNKLSLPRPSISGFNAADETERHWGAWRMKTLTCLFGANRERRRGVKARRPRTKRLLAPVLAALIALSSGTSASAFCVFGIGACKTGPTDEQIEGLLRANSGCIKIQLGQQIVVGAGGYTTSELPKIQVDEFKRVQALQKAGVVKYKDVPHLVKGGFQNFMISSIEVWPDLTYEEYSNPDTYKKNKIEKGDEWHFPDTSTSWDSAGVKTVTPLPGAYNDATMCVPYGDYGTIEVVEIRETPIASSQEVSAYTVFFRYEYDWNPRYVAYRESLDGYKPDRSRKGRVLVKEDPFEDGFAYVTADFTNADDDFKTNNVGKAIAK